jgi:hypothetical protein
MNRTSEFLSSVPADVLARAPEGEKSLDDRPDDGPMHPGWVEVRSAGDSVTVAITAARVHGSGLGADRVATLMAAVTPAEARFLARAILLAARDAD